MSRGTQNTLVLLVGLSIVVMVIKGSYLHFVKPSLLPWLIAAAVVLIVLAVVSIVRDLRHGPAEEDGHRHRPWLVWLLLVPIALTTFVVPPPLGAHGAPPKPSRRPSRKSGRFHRCQPDVHRRCRFPTWSCGQPPTPPIALAAG